MARPSKIDRLPKPIRDRIAQLREDGRHIDEIMEVLATLDVDVGRSTLARHTQELDVVIARLRESRTVAEIIDERLGDAPESRVARLNIELLHANIMKLQSAAAENRAVTLDAKEVMLTATAIQKLASAQKLDAEYELRLRREIEADLKKKAATAIDQVADGLGADRAIPADVIKRIREQIYGVFE